MLENWTYEPAVLARLSGHYEDLSQPLTDDLREKLIRARVIFVFKALTL
jgi:metallopeptidase MepB